MNRLPLVIAMLFAALQGCATSSKSMSLDAFGEPPDMQAVHGDLVEQMVSQGQYHAALAHIEELQGNSSQNANRLLLLHARVLFKLGQVTQAHAEYAELMGGPYDPEAMHGMGLIYAINDPALSLDYLGKAARGRPTNPDFRNDYGYALLKQGDYLQAQVQLVTACELAPQELKYRNNALLAVFLNGDETTARRLIEQGRVPSHVVEHLRGQANVWKVSLGNPSGKSLNTSSSAGVDKSI